MPSNMYLFYIQFITFNINKINPISYKLKAMNDSSDENPKNDDGFKLKLPKEL